MFDNDSHAGSWPELVARLDRSDAIARWSRTEPALSGLTEVADLVELTRRGCDGARADHILGALIRRASGPHRDDDALLLVLHLLSDVALALAADLSDVSRDVLPVIVDEMACQIRSLDLERVRRGWAVTLKWATRRAVLAEFRPGLRRRHPEAGERPVDVESACWSRLQIEQWQPDADDEDIDVVELLRWAVRHGVSDADIRLLTATETARATGQPAASAIVAAEFGIGRATLYRRNARTLCALRQCGQHYLAAAA